MRTASTRERIDEALFSCYLNTNGIPDPDLVIRTAGEMRLSNFLIWQAAYAEFYSTPAFWPDFDEGEVGRALEAYAERERRFGLVPNSNGKNGHANGSHANVTLRRLKHLCERWTLQVETRSFA